MIYFDNNASTPLLDEVATSMFRTASEVFGNPSSSHTCGYEVDSQIESARVHVASLVTAEPDQVFFTSGGTESNNWILQSHFLSSSDRCSIITSAVEHSSILKTVEYLESKGVDIVILQVDRNGVIDLSELERAIEEHAALVSIQWVNNETGVIQPIEDIADICRTQGVPLHVDGAQAAGKIPIDFTNQFIDSLTLSAHKIHGPQGIGALIVRGPQKFPKFIWGGDQEDGLRAGTQNVLGIVGFGEASRIRAEIFEEATQHLASLTNTFEDLIAKKIVDVSINGLGAPRAPGCTNVLFHGVDGQALLARLDQDGIMCSQSSACTNHRPEPSYVLRAMGLSEDEAYSSLRFSFSVQNTVHEVNDAVGLIAFHVDQIRNAKDRIRAHYN